MRRAVVVTALACAAAMAMATAPGAHAQGQVLGEVVRPTPVSAYAGHVVFSAWDPRRQVYRLMLSVDGWPPAPVRVAPRSVPFDADIGPGPGGGVHAIYSRCAVEPVPERVGHVLPAWNTARGCDLFRVDLATGNERRMVGLSSRGASEYLPSIWRGMIAFARRYDSRPGSRGRDPVLYHGSVFSSRPSTRLPGGERGTGDAPVSAGQPVSIDARGSHVAYVWNRLEGSTPRSVLHSVTRGGRDRVLSRAVADFGIGELIGPTQETPSTVVAGRTRLGAPQQIFRRGYGAQPGLAVRQIGPRRLVLALSRDHAVLGTRGTYLLDGPRTSRSLGFTRQCLGENGRGRCRIIALQGDPLAAGSPSTLPDADARNPSGDEEAAPENPVTTLLEELLQLPDVPIQPPPLPELPPLPNLPIPPPQQPLPVVDEVTGALPVG